MQGPFAVLRYWPVLRDWQGARVWLDASSVVVTVVLVYVEPEQRSGDSHGRAQ